MTSKPAQNGQGRQSASATAHKAPRKTVYVLANGDRVTSGRVTVQRRVYTPRARACKVCGVEFKPASKAAKYCSDACRTKAYRQRRAAEQVDQPVAVIVEALTCAHCQQGFFAVAGKHAQYCSPTCRASAYKARRKAAAAALADDLGVSVEDAIDALDSRGLNAIVAHLTSRGYLYDYFARRWVFVLAADNVFANVKR